MMSSPNGGGNLRASDVLKQMYQEMGVRIKMARPHLTEAMKLGDYLSTADKVRLSELVQHCEWMESLSKQTTRDPSKALGQVKTMRELVEKYKKLTEDVCRSLDEHATK